MSATVGPGTVNIHAGKFSHISVHRDPAGPLFTNNTNVGPSATDGAHNLQWDSAKAKLVGDHTLIVRLKAKARASHANPDPDSGQITVTVTNPIDTASGTVNYVNDPNA